MVTEAFKGEFYQKVDSKARVSIPAPMRRILEQGDPDSTNGRARVTMVYGAGGRFVQCFSMKGAQTLYDQIAQHDIGDRKDGLELAFVTRSAEVEIDEDGRLVLPPKVRDRMGVTPDFLAKGCTAAFAGPLDRFELWIGDTYDADTPSVGDDAKAIRANLALPKA